MNNLEKVLQLYFTDNNIQVDKLVTDEVVVYSYNYAYANCTFSVTLAVYETHLDLYIDEFMGISTKPIEEGIKRFNQDSSLGCLREEDGLLRFCITITEVTKIFEILKDSIAVANRTLPQLLKDGGLL